MKSGGGGGGGGRPLHVSALMKCFLKMCCLENEKTKIFPSSSVIARCVAENNELKEKL